MISTRYKMTYLRTMLMIAFVVLSSCAIIKVVQKPTLFLIGDSTVKNGSGKGGGSLWGWGSFIDSFFDLEKIKVENHALGGTSTRTFQSKGLWDSVLVKLQPGDYVIMQFGHNDGSPLDDTARARGTIKGIGLESKEIFNPISKKKETVYTYGSYLRKFINDVKSKGATAIVCSPIPRNPVKEGKVILATDSYAGWAKAVALAEKVTFIELNQIIKDKYQRMDASQVASFFTEKDHTHTDEAGARFNAAAVVEGLKSQKSNSLNKFLKQ